MIVTSLPGWVVWSYILVYILVSWPEAVVQDNIPPGNIVLRLLELQNALVQSIRIHECLLCVLVSYVGSNVNYLATALLQALCFSSRRLFVSCKPITVLDRLL